MFQNVSNCTLNSCTMNELSGHQENHFTTTNDHRTNCNNQRTVTTANSHNSPQKNELLEVPQADVLYEGLPQTNQNGRSPARYERESIQGGNLDDFDDMNQQLGESPLLPTPDSVTDLAYPNWQGHGNGESIPIPIHDQIEETRRMSAWQSFRNTLRSRSSGKSSPSVGRFVLNAEGA
ncbi:hypothetical protein PC9H_002219 [Pleurotus ostreatus]|uniref:Uncharacterized protein n=1 Tax=Pleurotus ostreatus TaxID=5322 RepID=A0A8H6ZI65_PLEOS|nr:uncharacterized protein PC9H_002219 [Pleurotus ostreatus]KAF7419628.1 hypothetical protein PC9H_002219 [Pleurotus ostreatus]